MGGRGSGPHPGSNAPTMDRMHSRANANDGCDLLGEKLAPGNMVVKAKAVGSVAMLEMRVVVKVEGNNIFLDNSPKPIRYSGRLLKLSLAD